MSKDVVGPKTGSLLGRTSALAVPILIYVVLAVLAFLPLSPWDPHTLPVCNCADYAKMTAYLEWTPWAILHGHNPFYTTYQDYPQGMNLATNTSIPFLGVLMAPLTLTAGPIASMNVVSHLALAGSATSAFLVLRRWVKWLPAAFAGGLLFGFSPYVFAHVIGHPNLIFIVLLPVLLAILDELFIRQKANPMRLGLLLGLVAAAQYGISSELAADAAVLSVFAVAFFFVVHRRAFISHARYAIRAVLWSLVTCVPLIAYPVWMVVAGPGHLTGPIQPLSSIERLRGDLLGALFPTRDQFLSFGHLGSIGSDIVAANGVENALYVGIPLLVLVIVSTILYRRDQRLVFASVMVAVCYVMSLGMTLNVYGHVTGIWLPFIVLTHLPLFDGTIALRFFVFGYLFLSVVLAITLEHVYESMKSWSFKDRQPLKGRKIRVVLAPAVCGLVAIVALVPLLPRMPPLDQLSSRPSSVYGSYAVPAYFSTSGGEKQIPAASTVLVYPYSTSGFNDYSVLWQAVGAEQFKLVDGNGTIAASTGAGQNFPLSMRPSLLQHLLLDAYFGPHKKMGTVRPPRLDRAGAVLVRKALKTYSFSTIVVASVGYDPQFVVRMMTTVLGRAPARDDGVYVWYEVQQDLASHGAGATGST